MPTRRHPPPQLHLPQAISLLLLRPSSRFHASTYSPKGQCPGCCRLRRAGEGCMLLGSRPGMILRSSMPLSRPPSRCSLNPRSRSSLYRRPSELQAGTNPEVKTSSLKPPHVPSSAKLQSASRPAFTPVPANCLALSSRNQVRRRWTVTINDGQRECALVAPAINTGKPNLKAEILLSI